MNKEYGFTEYTLHDYAAAIRDSWIWDHINSHIAQKIATRAFKAVQKKAFRKAKNVRFKGKNQFDTLEGKNNCTGLIFRDNTLFWSDLEIPCIIDENNKVIAYGLKPEHRIKYCRVVRRKINSKNRFYIQLILEGKPYQNPEKKIGNEEIGLDVGPSTIAIVGDTKAELKQFCSELVPKQKEKRKLQRKLDRQRRATNPQNYNENGTVKKPLSQRWHVCCGIIMQRDLYSAFLSKCVDVSTGALDIARARMLWPGLEPVLSEAVSRVIQSANGGNCPSSFGIGRRQSGSPVKPEATITEAVDDVIRKEDEDESHREVI